MYGEKETSKLPRIFLAAGHTTAILVMAWILFGMPAGKHILGTTTAETPLFRRALLLSAAIVYLGRVLATAFVLLKRRVAWSEALAIVTWVAFIHCWFALLGRTGSEPFRIWDGLALALYAFGSYLNTHSEYERLKWKRRPENAGHLYTRGLFHLSRHINYFGDVVLFAGYALLTSRLIALAIPALMVIFFTAGNIPTLDRYLAQKYGPEYQAWAEHTKRLVPFVY